MSYKTSVEQKLALLFEEAERSKRCFKPKDKLTLKAVRFRLNSGQLTEPFPGMYARNTYWQNLSRQDQTRHVIRTLSELHPAWVFSHSSAALMYNLEVPRELASPIHYITSRSNAGSGSDYLDHHRSEKLISVEKDGVALTSLEQTVVDCAANYPFQLALPIADSALHQGLTNKERLSNCLDMRINRRGVRQAKRVVEFVSPKPDNGGESRVRAIMHEEGLPEPELQARIPNPEKPGHYYYADFLFTRPSGTKVAMELDGMDKYLDKDMTNGRDSMQVIMAERQREANITSQGIQVVRFSYGQALNTKLLKSRLSHYGIVPKSKKRRLVSGVQRLAPEPRR